MREGKCFEAVNIFTHQLTEAARRSALESGLRLPLLPRSRSELTDAVADDHVHAHDHEVKDVNDVLEVARGRRLRFDDIHMVGAVGPAEGATELMLHGEIFGLQVWNSAAAPFPPRVLELRRQHPGKLPRSTHPICRQHAPTRPRPWSLSPLQYTSEERTAFESLVDDRQEAMQADGTWAQVVDIRFSRPWQHLQCTCHTLQLHTVCTADSVHRVRHTGH